MSTYGLKNKYQYKDYTGTWTYFENKSGVRVKTSLGCVCLQLTALTRSVMP